MSESGCTGFLVYPYPANPLILYILIQTNILSKILLLMMLLQQYLFQVTTLTQQHQKQQNSPEGNFYYNNLSCAVVTLKKDCVG